jgi:hypothetical protein
MIQRNDEGRRKKIEGTRIRVYPILRAEVELVLQKGQNEPGDLFEFGGFVEEAEGAQRGTNRAVGFVGLVGDHDDDDGGISFADDAEEFDAAPVREMDVEEEDIGRVRIDQGKRFTIAACVADLFRGKQTLEHTKETLDDEWRVIDDE